LVSQQWEINVFLYTLQGYWKLLLFLILYELFRQWKFSESLCKSVLANNSDRSQPNNNTEYCNLYCPYHDGTGMPPAAPPALDEFQDPL
jgi:hypothetical protein